MRIDHFEQSGICKHRATDAGAGMGMDPSGSGVDTADAGPAVGPGGVNASQVSGSGSVEGVAGIGVGSSGTRGGAGIGALSGGTGDIDDMGGTAAGHADRVSGGGEGTGAICGIGGGVGAAAMGEFGANKGVVGSS